MESGCSWADRIEGSARLTLRDEAAVRAAGGSTEGRSRTAHLLLACLTGEPSWVERAQIRGEDERVLAAAAGIAEVPAPASEHGPFQPRSRDDVIELWTERELTMVHAAWSLPGWSDAAERSARWLINEIQPDNATNLPWAVHVFAHLSVAEGSPDARMYAETLLHNCMVTSGRPDPLSALILLDASRQLRSRYAG